MLRQGIHALSQGKTALVTGSTDGIGLTTAKHLAAQGIHVLIHGRDVTRIQQAVRAVMAFQKQKSSHSSLVLPLPAQHLSTVSACKTLAQQALAICKENNLQLQILMNNAGVFAEDLVLTPEGLELTFAVNVMAPFVLTSLLLDELLEERSRIVIASSISQSRGIRDWEDLTYTKRRYSSHSAYSESKLLDAMLSMEFADRLKAAGFGPNRISCNCLDPGTVNTKMLLAGWGRIGIDVQDALDEFWLCTSQEVDGVTGHYFVSQTSRRTSGSAYDKIERSKLWQSLADVAPEAATRWETLQA
jgi:NAD(P)-dependent dehydrogenase (short-subunit alcohol dehydrogenase family)